MTVHVTALLGEVCQPQYGDRRVVAVPVAWDEASRRRLRRVAADGTDVAIELDHTCYLADGVVLHDDGERLLVVERTREAALVVRLDRSMPPNVLIAQALALGHAFGNQHVPIDVGEAEALLPLTTSEQIARRTVAALALEGATIEIVDVPLGSKRPLRVGHTHTDSDGRVQARSRHEAEHDSHPRHSDHMNGDGHVHVRKERHEHGNTAHLHGVASKAAVSARTEAEATNHIPIRQTGEQIATLAALQLADSALPIGRFVHSHGIEAWLSAHPAADPDQLGEVVESAACEAVAPLDGTCIAHSHRATALDELLAIDELLTARKLAPASRVASHAPGRQLAALAPRLAPGDSLLAGLCHRVVTRETDGNLAVVFGTLARALQIKEPDAVVIELRGFASSLLSAAVRLDALAPTRAQVLLARLAPALASASVRACEMALEDLSSSAPEIELWALSHPRTDSRLFTT
jgi:urease accessory protein